MASTHLDTHPCDLHCHSCSAVLSAYVLLKKACLFLSMKNENLVWNSQSSDENLCFSFTVEAVFAVDILMVDSSVICFRTLRFYSIVFQCVAFYADISSITFVASLKAACHLSASHFQLHLNCYLHCCAQMLRNTDLCCAWCLTLVVVILETSVVWFFFFLTVCLYPFLPSFSV